jgi:hypothetical protein
VVEVIALQGQPPAERALLDHDVGIRRTSRAQHRLERAGIDVRVAQRVNDGVGRVAVPRVTDKRIDF